MTRNGVAERETVEAATQETPAADRIDAGDLGHHAYILRQSKRLAMLQQQAQAIANEMGIIQGAHQSWIAYLTEKYGLPDGTNVAADGAIHRTVRAGA